MAALRTRARPATMFGGVGVGEIGPVPVDTDQYMMRSLESFAKLSETEDA